MVHVVHLETKHEWLWPKEKFINRKFVMEEMYNDYEDGDPWEKPAVSIEGLEMVRLRQNQITENFE